MGNDGQKNDSVKFNGLDRAQRIRVYRHHLPHWRQDGVVYFVTFRLRDSIPKCVLKAWNQDRLRWLSAHGISGDLSPSVWQAKYQQIPEGLRRAFERENTRRVHLELDQCHGKCVLRDKSTAQLVADTLHFHDRLRLHCGDFVVMPNHVHWLLIPYPKEELELLTGSVKRNSSIKVNRSLGRSGSLWQRESFDHIVRDRDQLDRVREYISKNAEKSRLTSDEIIYYRCDWLP